MKSYPVRMCDAEHIRAQALRMRAILDDVIAACERGEPIPPTSRNKCTGGSLAGDAAALGIEIVTFEQEQ